MYIKRVIVSNFRGIQQADIKFSSSVNILIGQNNVGKTTLLQAIDIVLNPLIQWWRRDYLSEFDFWRRDITKEISIEVVLGCGRPSCVIDDCSCPRIITDDGTDTSNICKLSHYTISVDNEENDGEYLTADNISSAKKPESVIRIRLTAKYNNIDGFVEVEHHILDEQGQPIETFSKPMKEWLGCVFLSAMRDPSRQTKLQNNSLLSNILGNLNEWRKKVSDEFRTSVEPLVKTLSSTSAKDICDLITSRTSNITSEANFKLALGETNDNDITRQIEICQIYDGETAIPLSRQGRGLQNVVTIILGISGKHRNSAGSILLLEEVEQNLEPPLQRNMIKIAQNLTEEGTQFIVTTHSPYILSPLLDLDGVQRLTITTSGIMSAQNLHNIHHGKYNFLDLRKKTVHDVELLEALFARLVVVWEGDSEAGLYPALMYRRTDYPADWLLGINGGNGMKEVLPFWLKKAGYDVAVVLDGDVETPLNKLKDDDISFLALPVGKALEEILAAKLLSIDKMDCAEILLAGLGVEGIINYKPDFKKWPTLHNIFETTNGCGGPLDTEIVLGKYLTNGMPEIPTDITAILRLCKTRRQYEAIGNELANRNCIPQEVDMVLDKLKIIWENPTLLKQYQLNDTVNPIEWKEV